MSNLKIDLKNSSFIPYLISVLGVIIIIGAFFLPYASATDSYKERLERQPDGIFAQEFNMTNEDVVNMSLFEYLRMYSAAIGIDDYQDYAIIYTVVIGLMAVSSLLTLIFVILRKPIAFLIFNCISFGVFCLINWDFNDRGIVPNNRYDFGAAYYLYYIGAILLFVGAIWFIITKAKEKKVQNNKIDTTN